jgi:hypothetical protein
MNSRRNIFIRSIASVTGDTAIGCAMASACLWVIQSAALGLFLSFLLWLLAIALSLALSQYVLHPAVSVLLCDRKLDRSLAVAADAVRTGGEAARHLWGYLQQSGIDIRSFRKTA